MPVSTPERRYITASLRAFGTRGFFGTTMQHIADEAGVTQPRISQVFNGKREAFTYALRMADDIVQRTIREAGADGFDLERLRAAMIAAVEEHPSVPMMALHAACAAPADPVIGDEARKGLCTTVATLAEVGATPAQIHDFMQDGYFQMAMTSLDVTSVRQNNPVMAAVVDLVFHDRPSSGAA